MFACLDPFRFVCLISDLEQKNVYASLVPIHLGPKRLGSETSRCRNGLVPKHLVTRSKTTQIPE